MDPGDPALLRHVFRGEVVAAALPVTVVEDSDDRVILHLALGTAIRWFEGRLHHWLDSDMTTTDATWRETNVLQIARPGRAHAVWAMWGAGHHTFHGWYVNLQEPIRRSALGWDTMDQELDIVVAPDLSAWAWKDEEPFDELVDRGVLSASEARAIRDEGEAVIADVEARRSPFDEPWPEWRPDPSWPAPTLPPDWDVL